MQRFTLWSATCLLAASFLSSAAFAQNTVTTVPDSVTGTWILKYEGGSVPFAAGTTVTLIIDGTTDTLCVNGKALGNPFRKSGSLSALTFWSDTASGFDYSWSGDAGSAEFVVWDSATAKDKGYFYGARSSAATTGCTGASTTLTPPVLTLDAQSQALMNLAMELYPSLFGSDGTEVRTTQGYLYRYFPKSGIYVGFKDGYVFLLGGVFGTIILNKGPASSVRKVLDDEKSSRISIK